MTFGEKLYYLRKAQGLSQEALAEKLNTSRQAVSKWENNNGYPETEKIILLSKLLDVNLDDLLLDEREVLSGKNMVQEKLSQKESKGFYVNRETANGFLLYYKKKFLLLAAACGIALACNAVTYNSIPPNYYELYIAPVLGTVSILVTLSIVIYVILKQNPYRFFRKRELVFDRQVRAELEDEFHKIKGILLGGIMIGLVVFVVYNSQPVDQNFLEEVGGGNEDIMGIIVSMILTGISSFITFFCSGIYWSYAVLLQERAGKEG